MSTKPKVFIGSSKEASRLATAFQGRILVHTKALKIQVWHQDLEYGVTFLETLLNQQPDFALLIFHQDDFTISRKRTQPSPRDNVVFECGLFLGKLGREKVFILVPDESELKIPTDLLGINLIKYSFDPDDIQSGIDPAALEIVQAIEKRFKKTKAIDSESNINVPVMDFSSQLPNIPQNEIIISILEHFAKNNYLREEDLTEFLYMKYISPLQYSEIINLLLSK